MGERPLEASENPLELPLRRAETHLVAAPRRLPPPLPAEIVDAPPPAWHRVLVTVILVLELGWLALLAFLVAWLFVP